MTAKQMTGVASRFKRQLLLKEVGGAGQQAIAKARVLIIGVGGLGCPVAQYLAAAGVGTIGLIDDDVVDESNLQRQILFDEANVGQAKVDVAVNKLSKMFSQGTYVPIQSRLTKENAERYISDYDFIADCCDNFATRYLLSDACYYARKPLISAAAIGFNGQLTTLKPYLNNRDGEPFPTYHCLVPEQSDVDMENCETLGVLGPVTGILGSMQALEILKEITGSGESLAGRLQIFDGLSGTMRSIKLPFDPANPLTGTPSK
jgi:molybdopterin-synthase adenylyltransferase